MTSEQTEKKTHYRTREAIRILAQARIEGDQVALSKVEKTAAAEHLRQKVLDAAEAAGCRVSRDKASISYAARRGTVTATILLDASLEGVQGTLTISGDDKARDLKTPISKIAIEYDPATKRWVGKNADTFAVPVPGRAHKRRSAVAVIAEAIVKAVSDLLKP